MTAGTAEAEAHVLDGRMLEMTQSTQILNCRSASPREGRIPVVQGQVCDDFLDRKAIQPWESGGDWPS